MFYFYLDKNFYQIPYAMLQVSLKNRKEYRVVCFNGEVQYIASINRLRVGTLFSYAPHIELFRFVKEAIRLLKHSHMGAIVDGIVRVDVMQNVKGEFKVNEFETFEANITHATSKLMFDINQKIVEYWLSKLISILN